MVFDNVTKVSVIIPCRNEERYIKNCIEAFLNQDYEQDLYEILICDGMSEDNTRSIVKEYSKKYKNVRLVDNPKKITSCALNEGITSSNGELIIIFGAHGIPGVDFISKNVQKINSSDAVCVGGKANTISFGTEGKAIAAAMGSVFGVGNSEFRYGNKENSVDTVGFGGYRRAIFNEIGVFDEEFIRNQDDELNFRIKEAGYKILFSPDIGYIYFSRSSYKALWRQYYQYGFWKVRVMQKHGKLAAFRHVIPAAFVTANVIFFILSLLSKFIMYLWLAELGSYFLISLFISVKLGKKNKIPFYYVLLSFPILHLSYGTGFISGLINFYVVHISGALKRNARTSRN
ncbi:glycosyltransferase family 2 protein [Clostridium oryzae]|uniref:Poly-beta-1,6-N-acetyl-D-glucosamine synthase n=1 Tax=Clostridium oryzae TaxID=1450648 RepID=A0A1V4IZ39_9CLOT|nr:glycosyltransferase family 2 protein [Clostridium oryzae]OPJ65045.1 poly-beta-1,6-N-acetyl-D-glucosamine synthase [Clostridium oryzae]